MKKLFKYSGLAFLSLLALLVVYLLIAWCFASIIIDKKVAAKEEVVIYIKTNGVHTDIVVPVKYDTP